MDGQNLLSNHGQHLEVNSVELVEARPSSAGGETLEELPEGNVIQTIGTVEHNTLLSHSLGQILGGLRFTGSCRSLGGTSQIQVERSEQCPRRGNNDLRQFELIMN